MTLARKAHPYYNYDKICSYNAVYNFLVGGRGLGKTYGAKKQLAIGKFLKRGEQFIYLRRFKTELKGRQTFFDDIDVVKFFPDWDFRVQGWQAQCAPVSTRNTERREWAVMGYFVALSTAQTQKSIAFPLVTTIIFDEFIIESGALHYLPSESEVFNNFYNTVDRYQDKTVVFFLANSVSIMNPYFLAYEIRPDEGSEFVSKAKGFIIAHFPDAKNFQSSVFETRFGQFIKNTEYADYAVGNAFADNSENLLEAKDSAARHLYNLETSNGKFSVWRNNFTNMHYVQEKLPKDGPLFTIVAAKMDNDKIFMTFTDAPLAQLRTAFRRANVMFDKPSTRNTFVEIFKR